MSIWPMRDYPIVSELWNGAILVSIAHAVKVARNPDLHYEVSWDGTNYIRQDSMGARGTVSFNDSYVVGVFSDIHSVRYAKQRASSSNWMLLFEGAPSEVVRIAESNTNRYLLERVGSSLQPVLTSAFWNTGNLLTGCENWDTIVTNGAHILRIEVMKYVEAKAEIALDYNFNSTQMNIIEYLFKRRIRSYYSEQEEVETRNYFGEATSECFLLSKQLLESVGLDVLK